MADGPSKGSRRPKKGPLREALDPIADSSSSSGGLNHMEALSKAILEPFQRKKADSSRILADLAPVLMTPRMMSAASSGSSRSRQSLGMNSHRMDFRTLGRAPLRLSLGKQRVTSTDLQIAEATDELLAAEIPEPEGIAQDVSLLRGFKATVPSSERGKARRRQMRNVETPRLGLKRLGMNARGLLMEEENSAESDDDLVVVGRTGKGKEKPRLKGKRRGRESLGASVALGKEELKRQVGEILLDKENIHVRRALFNNEIDEITRKINALDEIRSRLEQDLLKLTEDELELDDELQGVQERLQFEESMSTTRKHPSHRPAHIAQSSRRRKGPAFLPSEHDELPPGVAFVTLSSHRAPITSLDFSEPYGTLVSASTIEDNAPDADGGAPRVWDLLSLEEIGRLRGHSGAVKALQVEDHVCLTGGEDGAVRIWDLRRVGANGEGERDEVVSLGDITEELQSVAGSSDSTDHEGVDLDATLRNEIRNGNGDSTPALDSGACARVLEGHSKAVTALYFEENCLVTGAADKTLRQWDLATGQCVMTMDILWAISHPAPTSLAASAVSLYPATGSFAVPMPPRADGSWDMYQDFVGGVQFWGHALVSGSGDGAVRMWDMRTGQSHRSLLGHTGPVTCLQFDELHIVSGSLDRTIRIWDVRTGSIFETVKYDHAVTALQFDSRKVIAATGENAVKIYNRTTMQHSSLTTNGHTAPAERLRFMDRYLVSGGRDAAIKIWSI